MAVIHADGKKYVAVLFLFDLRRFCLECGGQGSEGN
jgi:hypothetical protein